jgi:hypothetical protein
MEFGWDPVVRNAVMKNVFDGFGAIRSYWCIEKLYSILFTHI